MIFDRPWALLLVIPPFLWLALTWARTVQRNGLLLKALAFASIALALAEPRWRLDETKVAVAVLADTSRSLSTADLAKESGIIGSLESARGRHWMRVMPFAGQVRELAANETSNLKATEGETGRSTDIELAVREAAGALPPGMVQRMVLLSDGLETRGSLARAAWQARQLGIPIDTYALAGRERPALRIAATRMPELVFSGERFAVELDVVSPRAALATVQLSAEGKEIGNTTVNLSAGDNALRLQASVASAGAVEISGSIKADGLGEARFARALALRRPRMLFLSLDPVLVDSHITRSLEAAQFEITRGLDFPPGSFDGYQVVTLNNWDLENTPSDRKQQLEDYVRSGGALVVIGGDHNVYVEKKDQPEDPLERALPAKIAPPRSPEGTLVVLIVDKSSSMEGKKMELARVAAIGVVENLRPIDTVGVLMFDNSFSWAVPIRKAEDKPLIKRLIAGITPDGGTQIAPALTEAYRRTLPVTATFKHIVLLTDGISEEGDSISLAKEAATQKVTISTVGLGQDVNRAYLEKVAQFAKGKSHFLTDPSGLEQILLRDVMEHTGTTAIEKPLIPIVPKPADVLDGLAIESAPALKGYIKFDSKPTADVVLKMDDKDPLYVRWQYGLGRSAVFTSDAKSRWAADWVTWPGFDKFWSNLYRDMLPRSQPVEASLRFDSASSELIAEYRFSRREPATAPELFVFGPAGFRRPFTATRVTPGLWRGTVKTGDRDGLLRVRPLNESRDFPEIGLYREEAELNQYGSNPTLLRQIADFTGGRFEPAARQVFDSAGRSVPGYIALWPLLLGLAVALTIAELVNRKWRGLLEWVASLRGA